MNPLRSLLCALALICLVRSASSQTPTSLDDDEAYRQRENLTSAQSAAGYCAEHESRLRERLGNLREPLLDWHSRAQGNGERHSSGA